MCLDLYASVSGSDVYWSANDDCHFYSLTDRVIENEILSRSGDGSDDGGVDDGRARLSVYSLVVLSVNATVSDLVELGVVAEKAGVRPGTEVAGTIAPVVPVEVVSEAYIVAVAAEGRMIVAEAVVLLDMGADMGSLSYVPASPVVAGSFGSTLVQPLRLRCRLFFSKKEEER
jgi:hypothetical protein